MAEVGPPERVTVVPGNHDAYVRQTQHRFAETLHPYLRGDDAREGMVRFPFLRRRGPLALIALSSAVPTAPLVAAGRLGEVQRAALDAGVDLEEGRAVFGHPIRPASAVETQKLLALLDPPAASLAWYRVVLRQGWKRQVRRMFAAVGAPIARLADQLAAHLAPDCAAAIFELGAGQAGFVEDLVTRALTAAGRGPLDTVQLESLRRGPGWCT